MKAPKYVPQRGGTVLRTSGPAHDPKRKHLHFICTNASEEGDYLLLPVVTWRRDKDDNTCILNAGDHRFIKHKSIVSYRQAAICGAEEMEGKEVRPHDAAPPQLIERVCRGILKSPRTPEGIRDYYRENRGNKPPAPPQTEKPA